MGFDIIEINLVFALNFPIHKVFVASNFWIRVFFKDGPTKVCLNLVNFPSEGGDFCKYDNCPQGKCFVDKSQ